MCVCVTVLWACGRNSLSPWQQRSWGQAGQDTPATAQKCTLAFCLVGWLKFNLVIYNMQKCITVHDTQMKRARQKIPSLIWLYCVCAHIYFGVFEVTLAHFCWSKSGWQESDFKCRFAERNWASSLMTDTKIMLPKSFRAQESSACLECVSERASEHPSHEGQLERKTQHAARAQRSALSIMQENEE